MRLRLSGQTPDSETGLLGQAMTINRNVICASQGHLMLAVPLSLPLPRRPLGKGHKGAHRHGMSLGGGQGDEPGGTRRGRGEGQARGQWQCAASPPFTLHGRQLVLMGALWTPEGLRTPPDESQNNGSPFQVKPLPAHSWRARHPEHQLLPSQ